MSINNLLKPFSQTPAKWTNLNVNSIKANTFIGAGPQSGSEGPITQDSNPKTTNISFPTAFTTIPKVCASITDPTSSNTNISLFIENKTVSGFDATVYIENPPTGGISNITTSTSDYDTVSAMTINGNPAVCYFDDTANILYFNRANDINGSSWGPPVSVDTGANFVYMVLEVIGGNPAIAYRDATAQNLKYVRATDVNGSSWDPPVVVDNSGDVGDYLDLAEVSGNPAIVHWDDTNNELKYTRATTSTGAIWNPAVVVATWAGAIVNYSNLLVVNGRPAITYLNGTTLVFNYIRADDATGTAWTGPHVAIDNLDVPGVDSRLIIVNGNPAVSYRRSNTNDIYYCRASNVDGSAWGTPLLITAGNLRDTAMKVIDGVPVIAYYDSGNTRYVYKISNNADGTSFGAEDIIETSSLAPTRAIDLLDIGGRIGVAFNNKTTSHIRFSLEGTFIIDYSINYLAQE